MSGSVDIGPRVDRRARLSPLQERVWTSQRLSADAPLANMAKAHRIRGGLDPAMMVAAVDHVVRSCDSLRTIVSGRLQGDLRAVVLHEPPASTQIVDVPAGEVDTWCADRISTPIDATVSPYDSVLLRHAEDDWTWWIDLHHVVTDAWASMLLFDAVSNTYEALVDGGDLPEFPSFYDHAEQVAARHAEAGVEPTDTTPSGGEPVNSCSLPTSFITQNAVSCPSTSGRSPAARS